MPLSRAISRSNERESAVRTFARLKIHPPQLEPRNLLTDDFEICAVTKNNTVNKFILEVCYPIRRAKFHDIFFLQKSATLFIIDAMIRGRAREAHFHSSVKTHREFAKCYFNIDALEARKSCSLRFIMRVPRECLPVV